MMDMMLRGRRGLTKEAVRDIINLSKQREEGKIELTNVDIANIVSKRHEINVARTTVSDILSGRRRLVMRNVLDEEDRAIRESGKRD